MFYSYYIGDMKDPRPDMISKYLKTYYPVNRVKIKTKFRRAIVIDGRPHMLLTEKKYIIGRLFNLMQTIYDMDRKTVSTILKSHYGTTV